MTRIIIEGKAEDKEQIQKTILEISKANNQKIAILYSKKKGGYVLEFTNGIFFNKEVSILSLLNSKFNILSIDCVSRSFQDIHDVESTKEFKDNLKGIQEKISPFYIIKKEQWWIGIKNQEVKDFNLNNTIREIYRIGLCCGLVPTTLL